MMNAGRELDALVAEKVMGCTVTGGPPVVRFSRDIDAAWQVVERIQGMGLDVHLNMYAHSLARTPFVLVNDGATTFRAEAATAPLAICLVALKALGCDLVAETKKEAPGETASPLDRGAQGSY